MVVHNGIIENYIELKKDLKKEGHTFLSDTDTEVIPHLIVHYMDKGNTLLDAVRATLKELKGSYALGILDEKEKILVAARKESPLIVGVGNGEYFISAPANHLER